MHAQQPDVDTSPQGATLSNVFPCDASVDSVTDAVRRDGYAIIEQAANSASLARVKAELGPHVDETVHGAEDFWGYKTKRFGALIAKSKAVQELLVNETILGVADRILLQFAASYWVNYTGVMYLSPEEKSQSLHRDTNLWPFTNPCPPLTLATMWAVSDFTRDNGGTLVVPGSHLWEDGRQPKAHEIAAVEMPAGSVLLYTGNVIHGGGANRSSGARFGVAIHYVLGWLRQEETQSMTLTRDETLALPDNIKRLIGYSLGARSLGMVDHLDPLEALTGIHEERPISLSTPSLDEAEAKMSRLSVVTAPAYPRTRYDLDDDAIYGKKRD